MMQLFVVVFVLIFSLVSSETPSFEEYFRIKLGHDVDNDCLAKENIDLSDLQNDLNNCKGVIEDHATKRIGEDIQKIYEEICEKPDLKLCSAVFREKLDACLSDTDKIDFDGDTKAITAEFNFACKHKKEELKSYLKCMTEKKNTAIPQRCHDLEDKAVKGRRKMDDAERCKLKLERNECEAESLKTCEDNTSVQFMIDTINVGVKETACGKYLPGSGSIIEFNTVLGFAFGLIHLWL